MRAHALRKTKDERQVVSKLAQKIKYFDNTDPSYKWEHFWTKYSVSVQNAAYSDSELRAIFLSCLEGSVLEHYRAFYEFYYDMEYDQLVAHFKERYDDTQDDGIVNLVGITQKSNEDVLSFRDRVLNTARTSQPVKPTKQRIIRDQNGQEVLVQNLGYEAEMLKYEARKEGQEQYHIRFYVMGLRDEIVHRMQTTSFPTLEAAAKAAKGAEDYLKSVSLLRTNHVRMAVNAMHRSGSKDYKGSYEKKTEHSSDHKKSGSCHSCGSTGHWMRECPYRNKSRSQSRDRGRSNSRSNSSTGRPSVEDIAEATVRKLSAMYELKPRNKNDHAKKGKRQGKKQRSGKDNRSTSKDRRSSQGRPRSMSRDRGRPSSRYGSRSNSRSNSKNGRQ
jgi:hypothetical protein